MTTCFTGHRPNKFPGGYDLSSQLNKPIWEIVRRAINTRLKEGETRFICGGALGVDTIAFEILRIKRDAKPELNIKIALAAPFVGQDANWLEQSKEMYRNHLDAADIVVYVDQFQKYALKNVVIGKYHPAKMQKRNEWMVDNSEVVIAVWNGDMEGGTANCVKYAKKVGKTLRVYDIPNA